MDKLLIDDLSQPAYQSKYCYLLLDMLGYVSEINPLHLESLQENINQEHIAIIARPELSYNLASCPHLICIKEPNGQLSTELINAGIGIAQREHLFTKNYFCGWIVSELPPEVLADKCLQFGIAYGKLLNMPFLPFYEPFRMQLLQDCNRYFSPSLESMIDWCDAYFYIDISQTLRLVKPNKMDSGEQFNTSPSEEEKYYQHHAKNLLALYRAWNNVQIAMNHPPIPEDNRQLIKLCEFSYQARTIGLTNIKDNDIYTLFSMQYGSLLNNDVIKKEISAAKNEPGTLAEKLKKIDVQKFIPSSDKF